VYIYLWSGNRKCIHANNILHGSKLFFGKIHLSMNGRRTNHISNGEKNPGAASKWHKEIRLAVACVAFNRQYIPTGDRGRSQQHLDGERRCGRICSRGKERVTCGELVEAHGLHQPSSLLTCASSSMGGRALRAAMTSTAKHTSWHCRSASFSTDGAVVLRFSSGALLVARQRPQAQLRR
jgi:hypothetical protein